MKAHTLWLPLNPSACWRIRSANKPRVWRYFADGAGRATAYSCGNRLTLINGGSYVIDRRES